MDWLTIAIIGILLVILLIVLWEKHQMQKEAELFASQVEEALDAILSGRKWKVKEELEDSLWGRSCIFENGRGKFERKRNRERLNFRYVASDKNTDCQYEAIYGTS